MTLETAALAVEARGGCVTVAGSIGARATPVHWIDPVIVRFDTAPGRRWRPPAARPDWVGQISTLR